MFVSGSPDNRRVRRPARRIWKLHASCRWPWSSETPWTRRSGNAGATQALRDRSASSPRLVPSAAALASTRAVAGFRPWCLVWRTPRALCAWNSWSRVIVNRQVTLYNRSARFGRGSVVMRPTPWPAWARRRVRSTASRRGSAWDRSGRAVRSARRKLVPGLRLARTERVSPSYWKSACRWLMDSGLPWSSPCGHAAHVQIRSRRICPSLATASKFLIRDGFRASLADFSGHLGPDGADPRTIGPPVRRHRTVAFQAAALKMTK